MQTNFDEKKIIQPKTDLINHQPNVFNFEIQLYSRYAE